MLVQLRTDNHIETTDELTEQVNAVVDNALGRFRQRITRVEVHLTDESSSAKSRDDDKRCVMEARLAGRQPVAVTNHGATVEVAMHGAANKLRTLLDRTLGKLEDPKGRTSYAGEQPG